MSGPLSPELARRVYDRIGRAQDWQSFYEDQALAQLLVRARIEESRSVLEFGCGTGRLAEDLLGRLGPEATYRGVDISPVMVALAERRLSPWHDRATVELVDGTAGLPAQDGTVDRFISTFVLDLLAPDHARAVLLEAARVLAPGGLAALASLAPGVRPAERVLSTAWMGLWKLAPSLLGGCRPISLVRMLDAGWRIDHRGLVRAYGLVSEVVVATRR